MVGWKELASISFVVCVTLGFSELIDASTAEKDGTTSVKLQGEILNILGLAHRPRPRLNTRLHGRKMSALRYMMDLYNSLGRNASVESEVFCCKTTVTDSRALGADMIMSYPNHVRGAQPKICKRHATFRFKMDTPKGKKITAAEFRIFKEPVFSGQTSVSLENSSYILKLYQVMNPGNVLILLRTKVLRSWKTGWEAFDISDAGRAWAKDPTKNLGLELSLKILGLAELDVTSSGFVGFHGPREKRPFLLTFYRQVGYKGVSYRRFYQHHGGRSRRSSRSLGPQLTNFGRRFTGSNKKSCSRRMLYVSFERLGWQDWIIAPDGYSAFFCLGECSFPQSAHMNATNHAIVQTLVNLMNPSLAPQPCCSPTKLGAISVLFLDDSNNVVLKKYPNMVVKACGCN